MNLYNDLKEAQSKLNDLQEEYKAINKGIPSLLEYYAQQISMLKNKIEIINDNNAMAEQMEEYFEQVINSVQ